MPTVRRRMAVATVALVVFVAAGAHAQDKELTEGHPVRLGDAFFVAAGSGSLLATGAAVIPRRGTAHGEADLELDYGVASGVQLSLAALASTDVTETREPSAGDTNVAGRVNLGNERRWGPSLAAQLAASVPTGVGSRSLDLVLTGYATKGLTVGLLPMFVHVNASADVRATGLAADERRARYHLVAGPSFTLPQQATTTIVADVFVDQARKRGEPETIGLELGARHRLAPAVAIHGAAGSTAVGPADRPAALARIGLSVRLGK